jgi:hypothetical protein
MLPDGRQASGAAAFLVPLSGAPPLWTGSADENGLLKIPAEYGCLLAVRHQEAGFLLRQWSPEPSQLRVELPCRAPPLVIHAVNAAGEPMPWARARLWVDDVELSGILPRLIMPGLGPAADGNGVWRLDGLPAGDIGVLLWAAYRSDLSDQIVSGQLDHRQTRISFPWSEPFRVEALQ